MPSDHNALLLNFRAKTPFLRPVYRRTLSGKWDIEPRRAAEACQEALGKPFDLQALSGFRQVIKPPSLRYKDPPEVAKPIRRVGRD